MMKWTYSIKNKFLASVALLGLCVLVLLSNYLDRIHTQHVKNSIATLYEDRLIAEDYILKMTSNIYQVREILHYDLNSVTSSDAINRLMVDFNQSYQTYIKTKLTAAELATAIELINSIKTMEEIFLINNYDTFKETEKALMSLNKLSTVQLEESKIIMSNAESEYAAIKTSSQFAFVIIIIILLTLQVMVFSAKTLIPVNLSKHAELN